DQLSTAFDQGSADAENTTELTAMRGQQMGDRDPAALDGSSEDLGVDAIGFSSVSTNADLLVSRGIHEQNAIAPTAQKVVDVPSLAAGLDSDGGRGMIGAEQGAQALDTRDRGALNNLSIGDLAIGRLLLAQIQCYVSHG